MRSPVCPACGAPVHVTPGHAVRCTSCARKISPEELREPPLPLSQLHPPSTVTTPQTRRVIYLLAIIPMLLAALGALASWLSHRNDEPKPKGVAAGSVRWSGKSRPLVTAIASDTSEDVVGVITLEGEDPRHDYLAAFDGAHQRELWRTSPIGPDELHVGRVGDTIVAIDARGVAHLYAKSTGKEGGSVKLPDLARRLCTDVGHPNEAFVELGSGGFVALDVASAKSKPASRPPWCAPFVCGDVVTRASCRVDPASKPQVKGFRADEALSDPKDGVAVGVRSTGVPTPMVVGFDPDGLTVRWETSVPGDDVDPASATAVQWKADLVEGRAIIPYRVKTKERSIIRLAAFVAASGKRAWDVEIPSVDRAPTDPRAIVVTATRAYVVLGGALSILDVVDGATIARIGGD